MKQRWNYGSLEDSSQTKKTEIERLIGVFGTEQFRSSTNGQEGLLPVFRDDSIRPACWTTNTKPRIDLVEEEPIPTPKFRRHAAIFEFWFIRHWDVTFSSDASAVEVLVQQNRSVCPWKISFRKNHGDAKRTWKSWPEALQNKTFGQLEVTFHGPTWKRI